MSDVPVTIPEHQGISAIEGDAPFAETIDLRRRREIELLLETDAKIHRLQDAAFFVWYIMEVRRERPIPI